MQHRSLGQLHVSALGLGCMGMSEFYGAADESGAQRVLERALDLGIDFFDTAETYGPYHNEALLGRFIARSGATVRIASKCGIVRQPGEYARTIDNSPDYIRAACEGSLRRLGVERIDLYYIHRVDPKQPIEQTMETLAELANAGKIAHIGLCEVNADTLRRAHAVHPVSALQTEYSLWTRDVEAEILPTCRELGIGFVAYSPLGRGFLTGRFTRVRDFAVDDVRRTLPRFQEQNLAANLALVERVKNVAARCNATAAQIALAWLLAQGEEIVPIPGTRQVRYLEDNTGALAVELTESDLAELAAPIDIHGQRYTPEGMKGIGV